MQCEMCGISTALYRAVIEDTEMVVCKDCGNYGKILGQAKSSEQKAMPSIKRLQVLKTAVPNVVVDKSPVELIVDDCSLIVRRERERMGLTQKEFASMLNEKESIIHKIETGTIEPDIKLARKLEKTLKIKLVEDYAENDDASGYKSFDRAGASEPGRITIGDLITVRKRT